MRIVAGVEYDGSAYHGWQTQQPVIEMGGSQTALDTIQARCEAALSRIADHPIAIACAGRTDKGVHATGQIIHFDTTADRTMHAWVMGSNHYLPANIRLLWAKPIDDNFHARYEAISRRYRYTICTRNVRPALMHNQVSWYPHQLDVEKMSAATQHLIGEHDFSAFRGADCQAKTTIRRVNYITLNQQDEFITLNIQANAFLHHMVRNIVGVLLAIGHGDKEIAWAQEVLQSRQRRYGGITAAPHGLCLMKVEYPAPWKEVLPS